MPEFHAYTDESGNTGMNLFDGQQPWFWTVTLVAPKDIELPAEVAVERWARDVAVPDLHANELGLRRLDEIAWPIHAFLAEHDCRFILTRLEKRHHATLKYVDTVIDSGINPAIPGYFYAFRPLRFGLAYAIASNFSPRNQEEWWEVFQRGDLDGFRRITRRVRINVDYKVKDPRLRELAMDALTWALEHPDSFPELTLKRGPHDSPNFVEFTVIVQLLHRVARDYGMEHIQIKRFVHDEQNQFAKFMREAFELSHKWEFSDLPLAWMTDMAERDTYHCDIQFESRRAVAPLRIADIALWLVRRCIERGDAFPHDALRLVNWISERAAYNELSEAQLKRHAFESFISLANLQVTPEHEQRGRELLARLEAQRHYRLRGL